MAVAGIIGAAIGVMLLIIVAYLLVGSTLTTAEVVTTAQKDITLLQEIRLRTSFKISYISPNPINYINISIENTGSEVIRDFSHMDIFVNNTDSHQHLTIDDSSGNIRNKQLGPDMITWINASFPPGFTNAQKVIIVTSNGVYTSAYV